MKLDENFKKDFEKAAVIGGALKLTGKVLGLSGPIGLAFGGMTAWDTVQKTRGSLAQSGSSMNIPASFYGAKVN